MEDKENTPVVFISYSWDTPIHKQWVLKLADLLLFNGVDVLLDQYELSIGKNMFHFMEQSVKKATKVLMIFTENYALKADKKTGGVGFEYSIITPELYSQFTNNSKFLPILRKGEIKESVPSFIQSLILMDMRSEDDFDENFITLLKVIYDIPIAIKPKLGKKPDFNIKNIITTPESYTYPTEVKLLEDYHEQTEAYRKEIHELKTQISTEREKREAVVKSSKKDLPIVEKEKSILDRYHIIMKAGKDNDVDFLMNVLISDDDFRITKFVDAALSSTSNTERITHYLFNGIKKQRNYAALYLKRNNQFGPLQEAVHRNLIDRIQAFSK